MPRTRVAVQVARTDEAIRLGRQLAALRTRAGISQLEAARALGIAQSALAKVELGQRQLRYIEGMRLAKLYSFDPASLAAEVLAAEPD